VCLPDEAEDQFNFATGLLIKKEYELAADEFRSLLKTHPDYPAADLAFYRLGEALYELKDLDGAVEAFTKVTTYPQSAKLPQSYYRLGQLTSESDHKAASRHYATVAERWPQDSLAEAALYWAAEELFRAEAWAEAAKAYRHAMTKFPAGKYAAESVYSLAWSEYKGERFEPAAGLFGDFLQKYPAHDLAPECQLRLAESLHKLKKFDEARAAYSKVGDGTLAQEAAIGTAWCLYEQKHLLESAAEFAAAAQALGKDPRAATCTFNAGNALVESKEFEKALAQFSRIVADHPQHELAPESAYWQGYCLVRLDRFAEADAALNALKSSSKLGAEKRAKLLHTLAGAKFGQKAYKEAAAIYAGIVKDFPDDDLAGEAAYGRMIALEKADDMAAAEAAGGEFFARFGDSEISYLARFALGEYRFRLKKYREAAADFEQFLAGEKQAELGDDAQYKLGWCTANLGEPAKATAHFLAVARKDPKGPLAAESVYMAGRLADEAGDKAAGRKHYAACLNAYPGTEHAQRSELALLLLDLGEKKHEAVLAGADAFLKKGPPAELADHANVYRGEALIELGRLDEALASYARVSKRDGGSKADASYGSAWVHRKKGRHEEAGRAFFAVASMKSAAAVDAEFWGCRSLEDAGALQDATQAYEKFAAAHPDSPHADEAAYRQALCAFKAKRFPEAEGLYAAYVAAHPGSALADNALYDLAWICKEKKDSAGAAERLARIIEQHPKSELVPDVNFRLGEMAHDKKDYAKAVSYYETVAAGDIPFGDKVLYKLGWCHDYLGQPEQAAATFARLWEKFPKSELVDEAHYRAGKLRQKQGKYPEAIKEYSAVGPGDFAERALFQSAECLRTTQGYKEAVDSYGKVLKDYPKTEFASQVNLGLGHCYRALTAYQDAIDAYQSVVKSTDTIESASALLGIGYSYYAQAMYKDAVKAFLKVDILYGYDSLKPEALDMAAKSWGKQGKADKAKKCRDELRERYPDSKFVAAVSPDEKK